MEVQLLEKCILSTWKPIRRSSKAIEGESLHDMVSERRLDPKGDQGLQSTRLCLSGP